MKFVLAIFIIVLPFRLFRPPPEKDEVGGKPRESFFAGILWFWMCQCRGASEPVQKLSDLEERWQKHIFKYYPSRVSSFSQREGNEELPKCHRLSLSFFLRSRSAQLRQKQNKKMEQLLVPSNGTKVIISDLQKRRTTKTVNNRINKF